MRTFIATWMILFATGPSHANSTLSARGAMRLATQAVRQEGGESFRRYRVDLLAGTGDVRYFVAHRQQTGWQHDLYPVAGRIDVAKAGAAHGAARVSGLAFLYALPAHVTLAQLKIYVDSPR